MLKKLLKYEFQATGRIFLPLYGALIVVAFIQRLFLAFNLTSYFIYLNTLKSI
jgi:hypothetical protein